ncbi:NAD(P)H-dependent oxidoreductase [uncultured Propionibacterium sp.]|uniref:NADPH-dependent FMN reductase n=1 Tax=uncultured Propionibacterium sp. TaxID=218066 RepID=UPI00292F6291|nr:NAD(P)H-dependent oxidoreductase [uncultured Propionibacterium sp.]
MKIGIVLGSVREGRAGESVARWVLDGARAHGGADFELIDLKFFNLPVLDGAYLPIMANKRYANAIVQAWSNAIDGCDAFVIVTPEYNHSVPGALKNAVDHLGGEWNGKPVAFVGYGADGAVRAVEHWRQIFGNFDAKVIRAQLSINIFAEMGENGFTPNERRAGELDGLLDSLIANAG